MDRREGASQRKSALSATAAIFVVMAAYSLCNNAMTVLMNEVIDEFSLGSALQGLMNGAIQLGGGVSVVLMPFVQGRVKKTLMLALSIGLQAASAVLTGAATLFPVLLAACLMLGMGGGWVDNFSNSCIVDIHQKNSGRYMGLLHACYATGAILTPLLLQGLLAVTGWRGAYFIIAGIAAAATVYFVVSSRRARSLFAATTDGEQKLTLATVKLLFKDRYNLAVMLCLTCYFTSQSGLTFWVVRYMKLQYDNEWLGSLALSLFWVGTVLSRLIAPRLPVRPMVLVAWGAALAAVFHTVGVYAGNPYLMVAVCALNGLVSGHTIPLLFNESLSRFPGNTSLPTSVISLISRFPVIFVAWAVAAVAVLSLRLSIMLTVIAGLATALSALLALSIAKKQKD